MSRSALWHQERNIQRRSKEADATWDAAIEEGRNNRARNLIPLWGPDDTFRFEPMLLNAIKKSNYFLKLCREITSWTALVDEIYYKVDGLEPWAAGGGKTPSMAFCLLLRLLTMRSTTHQMQLMLDHQDSPYIRAIGFLYLRYTCDPKDLFKWFKPYLYDQEPISISAAKKRSTATSGSSGGEQPTIGSLVRSLLSSSNRDFYGTMLPRLPSQIERDIQVQLLQAEKVEKRAALHASNKQTMAYFQKLGSKVMATYEDDDNPLQWYKAEVDRVVLRGEDGSMLKYPRFVVTFTEYGNTETVLLGEMDVLDGNFVREDQQHGGSGAAAGGGGGGRQRGNNSSRSGYDSRLYEEVRRREREGVTASGRGDYYAGPAVGVRDALQAPADHRSSSSSSRHHRHRHSPSPPPYDRKRSPPRDDYRASNSNSSSGNTSARDNQKNNPPPRKRTAEEVAALQEKKRKLMAKYG